MSETPDRLQRRGRPADPDFTSEERLFRRVPRSDFIDEDGFVTPAGVPLPDLSTNREKYSEPGDVLIGHEEAVAVAAAKVGDIPNEIDEYEFRPVHHPETDNYAHTEVRAFLDGQHFKDKPPKWVRKAFRVTFQLKVLPRL